MDTQNFTQNYYQQIYLKKTMDLAKSIVVKSEETAKKLNEWVSIRYQQPVSSDKRTWRYYLNIAGEYHFSNPIIKVISIDTLEEIVFNKENLKYHKATLREYQYGTRKYEELITRYPFNEALILGILYPCDIDEAIKAPNGKILSYPPKLVEDNEISFIYQLQQWIDGYLLHNQNTLYGVVDDLYYSASMAVMYLNMIPAIINIRKKACLTNEAHSYHVRQYLASHGFLDDYLDTMTKRQALRFYQNITWVERHIGKTQTFNWLMKEILTVRRFPLAEYRLNHDTKNIPLKNINPTPVFHKRTLNGLEDLSVLDDLSIDELLDKEVPLAPLNKSYIEHKNTELLDKLTYSRSNVLQTKVLESKVIDQTNRKTIRLEDTLLNLWKDMADKDLFKAYILIDIPRTGDRIPLKPKDAYLLYLYCWLKATTESFDETIPPIYIECVPREELPSYALFAPVLPHPWKDKAFLDYLIETTLPSTPIISIEAFYEHAVNVNTNINKQLKLANYEGDFRIRGYKEAAVYRLYQDKTAYFAKPNQTWDTWLEEHNIVFNQFTRTDYAQLMKSIFEESTGVNINTKLSMRVIHASMIRLMQQLSSYSVQYIKEISDGKIRLLDWIAPRTSTIKTSRSGFMDVDFFIEVIETLTHQKSKQKIDLPFLKIRDTKEHHYSKVSLDIVPKVRGKARVNTKLPKTDFKISCTLTNVKYDEYGMPIDENLLKYIEDHPEDRDYILEGITRGRYYTDGCKRQPNTAEPLEWSLPITQLDGFDHPEPSLYLKHSQGFDYPTQTSLYLKHSSGFHYEYSDELKLVNPGSGFHHQPPKVKDISEVFKVTIVNGFGSDKSPPLVIKDHVDGFHHEEPKLVNLQDIIKENRINGFVSHLDKIKKLPDIIKETEIDAFADHINPKDFDSVVTNKVVDGFVNDKRVWNLEDLIPNTKIDGFVDHHTVRNLADVISNTKINGFKSHLPVIDVITNYTLKNRYINGFLASNLPVDIGNVIKNTKLNAFTTENWKYRITDMRPAFTNKVINGFANHGKIITDFSKLVPNTKIDGFRKVEFVRPVQFESIIKNTVIPGFISPKQAGLAIYSGKEFNAFHVKTNPVSYSPIVIEEASEETDESENQ